jgi:phage shock protein PspC (stress-responsive transcriptional regulator)
MKKTISINIGGMIFHIEEDCYDKLKEYLNSIYKYFATYEDSQEIIADIDSRIAEIFCDSITKQKQVIVSADVEALIATMGSVDDFQAVEEDPAFQLTYEEEDTKTPSLELPTEDDYRQGGSTIVKTKPKKKAVYDEDDVLRKEALIYAQFATEKASQEEETGYKRLYRDTKHCMIGGVASGIAHYFGIEAIWIRILFLAMNTGFFFEELIAPSSALLIYIILWMIVPKNDNLEENPRIKKLYRDPEKGVMGGVCRGMAVYFGIDEKVFRFIAIAATFFFGTGFMLYLILWMIIPEAKTVTEKMEMEGETINLKNIWETINEIKFEEEQPDKRSAFSKFTAMPFVLFGLFMQKLAYILRPFVSFTAEAIRIGGGLTLILTSLSLTLALVAVLFVQWGWGAHELFQMGGSSVAMQRYIAEINNWTMLSFYTTAFIPTLFLGMFGVMMLMRRVMWNWKVGVPLIGIWLLSGVGTGVSIAMLQRDFRIASELEFTQNYPLSAKTLQLDVNYINVAESIKPQLTIHGYSGKDMKLIANFIANGRTEGDARLNAQMMDYNVRQTDSTLWFDDRVRFKKNAKYRNQHAQLHLYIPYEKAFVMSSNMSAVLWQTLTPAGYEAADLKGNTWKFSGEQLVCLTCQRRSRKYENEDEKITESMVSTKIFKDFDQIEAQGYVKLKIQYGEKYEVKMTEDGTSFSDWHIEQHGDRLEIHPKRGDFKGRWLYITTPKLAEIHLEGACEAEVSGFENIKELEIQQNGASKLRLQGKSVYLKAELNGASKLEAFEWKTQKAEIQISGAGLAKIDVSKTLEADLSGASKVRYRGSVKSVQAETSGLSTVVRED